MIAVLALFDTIASPCAMLGLPSEQMYFVTLVAKAVILLFAARRSPLSNNRLLTFAIMFLLVGILAVINGEGESEITRLLAYFAHMWISVIIIDSTRLERYFR